MFNLFIRKDFLNAEDVKHENGIQGNPFSEKDFHHLCLNTVLPTGQKMDLTALKVS